MTYPLISCIMPTTGARRSFLHSTLQSFLEQDYPAKELVIVDEPGYEAPIRLSRLYPKVQLATLNTHLPVTIGAKRNLAVSLARGDVICHWDDDDDYSPDRLSRQAEPILSGQADVTGFPIEYVLDETVSPARIWTCSPALSARLFPCGVHGGTLMYRRALWNPMAAFANVNSGEDGDFLRLLLARGARLMPVENHGSFIYVRHDPLNRWPLEEIAREAA